MQKRSLLILIVLLAFACKKESKHDNVITPPVPPVQYPVAQMGEYFPVYRGSVWYYLKSNGDTVIHKTDTNYILMSNYNPFFNPYDTTKYYASKYDGIPVNKYSLCVGPFNYHQDGWKTLLPNVFTIGHYFTQYVCWPPSSGYEGMIISIDTSIIINSTVYDSVVVVREFTGPYPGTAITIDKVYYARSIGIIKKEYFAPFTDSITSEENIIGYTIGK